MLPLMVDIERYTKLLKRDMESILQVIETQAGIEVETENYQLS